MNAAVCVFQVIQVCEMMQNLKRRSVPILNEIYYFDNVKSVNAKMEYLENMAIRRNKYHAWQISDYVNKKIISVYRTVLSHIRPRTTRQFEPCHLKLEWRVRRHQKFQPPQKILIFNIWMKWFLIFDHDLFLVLGYFIVFSLSRDRSQGALSAADFFGKSCTQWNRLHLLIIWFSG